MKIKKFNESIRDKMTPKSKEDITKSLESNKYIMTVGKLKKFLKKYPDDMLVAAYNKDGDVDLATEIVINKNEELYYKGNSPDFIFDLDEDILTIKGINEDDEDYDDEEN